jgi:hypothetical protein
MSGFVLDDSYSMFLYLDIKATGQSIGISCNRITTINITSHLYFNEFQELKLTRINTSNRLTVLQILISGLVL